MMRIQQRQQHSGHLKKVLINALKAYYTHICHLSQKKSSATYRMKKSPSWYLTGLNSQKNMTFKAEENAVETIKEAVRNIRNVRAEMNVPPSKKANVYVVSEEEEVRNIFENGKVFFATLGYASEVTCTGR